MHQAGQVQLTLLCEGAQVFVVLEEVQQLRGVGHPEGHSAGNALLPLQGKRSGSVTRLADEIFSLCVCQSSSPLDLPG